MKKNVDIVICSGTLCYLMGGAELQMLNEHLPLELKDRVNIKGSPCLNLCDFPENGRPPFAKINGRNLSQVTIQSLIAEIQNELNS
ncbi:MAG TPA: (2Fe-2S) ferredoxin domain-containing protein [Tenuifilaceae bacterium]|nr:(2Fe-2S) ferredoxin domain-containing protein [Tenuifilaceae bacterium]HOZ15983.1 (2Fe-2S) ferredoxin domain-containing protein [Tenuifilaceae bacterium]HPI45171.1 (2Fe-2S) ferredoxin domain-containing protein [Tenuifilaceae bacterium]HPN21284.1 (2Fe-2S) ferredoxin domain-containing protein [Tenuifilaceae bacterium]HPV56587.1 (2Fe-2S) ferredoxin domain-containing protein [Tenuifilaceae bacterium]